MNGKPPSKGHYERVLPLADQPLDSAEGLNRLFQLARAMTDDGPWDSTLLPAGYTYFGQFVDHDLTFNDSPLDVAPPDDLRLLPNYRTSYLDLDHVYGDGPETDRSGCLYGGEHGAERFQIGPTDPSISPVLDGGTPDDLFFDGNTPLIGDGFDLRNAENLILRQVHVLFLKFHNAVIHVLPDHDEEAGLPNPGETLFGRARLLTTWTYQYVVWHDFLMTVTNARARKLRTDAVVVGTPFALPLEFALAAFRFGHSMVREGYPLNCYHDSSVRPDSNLSLYQLFNPHEKSAHRLEAQFVIEWGRFFPLLPDGVPFVKAREIDTHITDPLRNLPEEVIRLFSQPERAVAPVPNLAQRTLERGARAELASGQQAHQAGDYDLSRALAKDGPLQEAGLTKNTPLWYYILKEAEVSQRGERLGDVGSRIVCDTIEKALQHDSNSFLNQQGANWKPPGWIIPVNYRSAISQLVEFVLAAGDSNRCAT